MKDMKNHAIFIILFMLLFGLITVAVWSYLDKDKSISVNNFEDCVEAGYPVMESYPRRCSAPDGRTFTEDIGEAPVEINVEGED